MSQSVSVPLPLPLTLFVWGALYRDIRTKCPRGGRQFGRGGGAVAMLMLLSLSLALVGVESGAVLKGEGQRDGVEARLPAAAGFTGGRGGDLS